MFDSSVYLSLYLKDRNHTEAIKAMKKYRNFMVQIPYVVIIEIVNILNKNQMSESRIRSIIHDLTKNPRNKIIYTERSDNWIENIMGLSRLVRLRSNDLLILSFAAFHKPSCFISFDLKLQKAYEYINKQKL